MTQTNVGIVEWARRTESARAIEMQLAALLGGWVPRITPAGAKLLLARHARHFAWTRASIPAARCSRRTIRTGATATADPDHEACQQQPNARLGGTRPAALGRIASFEPGDGHTWRVVCPAIKAKRCFAVAKQAES